MDLEEEFICVFTERESVPSLFDCLQTSGFTVPLFVQPLPSGGGNEQGGE